MKKVVILGATSGIAIEVQRQLAGRGCEMLLVARSPERLAQVESDLRVRGAPHVVLYAGDPADISQQAGILAFASSALPDFDTVLLAYGSMHDQALAATSIEVLMEELEVDFVSAAAILTLFAADLERRRSGCIAAISSVAGDRGRRSNYVYGSAKGGLALFLQGLRGRLYPAGVYVITIKPGPVRTPMTDQLANSISFADPRHVARDIVRSLVRRSPDILYTPATWRYIMLVVRLIPEAIFKRLPSF
jgi:decaprenylphospho-beta-D-erythro-pentofuranosid-2-ulose 2-reductase